MAEPAVSDKQFSEFKGRCDSRHEAVEITFSGIREEFSEVWSEVNAVKKEVGKNSVGISSIQGMLGGAFKVMAMVATAAAIVGAVASVYNAMKPPPQAAVVQPAPRGSSPLDLPGVRTAYGNPIPVLQRAPEADGDGSDR